MTTKDQIAIAKLYIESNEHGFRDGPGYGQEYYDEIEQMDANPESSMVVDQRKFINRLWQEIYDMVKAGMKHEDNEYLRMMQDSLEDARAELLKIQKWEKGEGKYFRN
jgi:hypothetical protein